MDEEVASNLERDIGTILAKLENLETRLDKIEKESDEMYTVITKAKGGWIVLVLTGGAVTWFIHTIIPYLKKVMI
jgi:chromosome condensin MukBEF ATPase and DNA-binding subunit MukB